MLPLLNSKSIPGKVKTHEVCAVATSLQLFNKVHLQAVMKAGRWSSGGTFMSYLGDLCSQADSIRKTGLVIAAGEIVRFPPRFISSILLVSLGMPSVPTLRCREERYPCTPLCVGFR